MKKLKFLKGKKASPSDARKYLNVIKERIRYLYRRIEEMEKDEEFSEENQRFITHDKIENLALCWMVGSLDNDFDKRNIINFFERIDKKNKDKKENRATDNLDRLL